MLTARTLAALMLTATVATGCDFGDEGIGSEGGVVVSDDGRMALEIPAGALDEAVDITIEAAPGPDGSATDLYVIEPMGLTFSRPAVLVYDYDYEDVDGVEAEALTMVASREVDWAYLPDQLVDEDDQTVSATVMALSAVTVVLD